MGAEKLFKAFRAAAKALRPSVGNDNAPKWIGRFVRELFREGVSYRTCQKKNFGACLPDELLRAI